LIFIIITIYTQIISVTFIFKLIRQKYNMICYEMWYMIKYNIRYDMLYDMVYDMILYDMIYLLTANVLTPGGSSTVHIYTQTIHKTIQITIEQHK
jgi:hypothetical protein